MASRTVETKFFKFRQNNSGGRWVINDKSGIGVVVWVEGLNNDDARHRAENIGIYFDGCSSGRDCDCCGDRWSSFLTEIEDEPKIEAEWDFSGHDTIYVHHMDGKIERIKADKSEAA